LSAKKNTCKIKEKEIVCEVISTSNKGITVCSLEKKQAILKKNTKSCQTIEKRRENKKLFAGRIYESLDSADACMRFLKSWKLGGEMKNLNWYFKLY